MFCLDDSYCKECEANVVSATGKNVVLDKNIFYPRGGGQPTDKGKIIRNNEEFNVLNVTKVNGQVTHELDKEGLQTGDKVKCIIDWNRRYKLMRMHTASHVFGATMYNEKNALVTGNQIEEDQTRFDFNVQDLNKESFEAILKKVNEILRQDINLKIYSLPREEAMKIDGVVKLANALPPSISILRIVEIPGVDLQADGGTHVKSLKEVGQMELVKFENKGSTNKRIYFKLTD